MDAMQSLNLGLGALPLITSARTRSISAENPTGEKGKGGMAIPAPDHPVSSPARDLGQGWKVRPFIWLKSGETSTLMDVEGPGVIQHIWMTTMREWGGSGRGCVLRFYWDDEETPSVEVPLTDFFAVGHDLFAPVNSLPVVVNPTSALTATGPCRSGTTQKSQSRTSGPKMSASSTRSHTPRQMSQKTRVTSTPNGVAPSPTDRIPITPSSTA